MVRIESEGRYAQAARATVALSHAGGPVELQVADDGIGLRDVESGRGGIRGMRERALLLGGLLTVGPSAAGGTAVRLRVPVIVNGA